MFVPIIKIVAIVVVTVSAIIITVWFPQALTEGSSLILEYLNNNGTLLKQEKIIHSYPYDWRTKKPVILRASEQWFIDVEKIRPNALEALQKVEFIPPNGKQIMTKQLESRPYWCISRQRTWGIPIPVFYTVDGRPLINEQSARHISNLISQHGSDVWWKESDEVLLPCPIRENLRVDANQFVRKGTDIMDIWLESGTSWAAALGSYMTNLKTNSTKLFDRPCLQ